MKNREQNPATTRNILLIPINNANGLIIIGDRNCPTKPNVARYEVILPRNDAGTTPKTPS